MFGPTDICSSIKFLHSTVLISSVFTLKNGSKTRWEMKMTMKIKEYYWIMRDWEQKKTERLLLSIVIFLSPQFSLSLFCFLSHYSSMSQRKKCTVLESTYIRHRPKAIIHSMMQSVSWSQKRKIYNCVIVWHFQIQGTYFCYFVCSPILSQTCTREKPQKFI